MSILIFFILIWHINFQQSLAIRGPSGRLMVALDDDERHDDDFDDKNKSNSPIAGYSSLPSARPSSAPSFSPSDAPTTNPSFSPSKLPSRLPSPTPSSSPSILPTNRPTNGPSQTPSKSPTDTPSSSPSFSPTSVPSSSPSSSPSDLPSYLPSHSPTSKPSKGPSQTPSTSPIGTPSSSPSLSPTSVPSTSSSPSAEPTQTPSIIPSTTPTEICPETKDGSFGSTSPNNLIISYRYAMEVDTEILTNQNTTLNEIIWIFELALTNKMLASFFEECSEKDSLNNSTANLIVGINSLPLDLVAEETCGTKKEYDCHVMNGKFTLYEKLSARLSSLRTTDMDAKETAQIIMKDAMDNGEFDLIHPAVIKVTYLDDGDILDDDKPPNDLDDDATIVEVRSTGLSSLQIGLIVGGSVVFFTGVTATARYLYHRNRLAEPDLSEADSKSEYVEVPISPSVES